MVAAGLLSIWDTSKRGPKPFDLRLDFNTGVWLIPTSFGSRMMNQEIKKIDKPWGYELIFAHTDNYVGKVLVIHKGEELSLQYHEKKEETIYVAKGKLEVIFEDKTFVLDVGQTLHIAPQKKHRMKALEETEVFEVSTPELDDVVRLKDHYGRA